MGRFGNAVGAAPADWRAGIVVAWACVAGADHARAEPANPLAATHITVRLAPGVDPRAIEYLDQHAEAQRAVLTPEQTVEELVARYYGVADDALVKQVIERNADVLLGPSGKPVSRGTEIEIALPPGPRWSSGIRVPVPEGSRVGNVALLYAGFEGQKTLNGIATANGMTRAELESVPAGREIVVPDRSLPTTVKLRPDSAGKAEEIVAALRAIDPERVLVAEEDPPMSLVPFVEASALAGSTTSCPPPTDESAWPFRVDDLVAILENNVAMQRGMPKVETIVAVADNGVPLGDARFAYWENGAEAYGKEGENDDGNDYFDDVVGADVVRKTGQPTPDSEGKEPYHGTHVAGLVFGGTRDGKFTNTPRDRILLMVLKINGGPNLLPDGVSSDAVLAAIRYASSRAQILNLSVERYAEWGVFRDTIGATPALLIVAAAGNRGRNLSIRTVYPAATGGKGSTNVITVGALSPTDERATFSNYGANTVDLLAPGCSLESTVPDGSVARYSGTSAAAPLVSFTAALVHRAGVREAWQIKQRILASVEPIEKLEGEVWAGGKLNVAAAVDVFMDRIDKTDGTLLRGEIMTSAIDLDGDPVPLHQVLKLVPRAGHQSPFKVRVALRHDRRIEFADTYSRTSEILIQTEAGEKRVSLSEIRNLVRRTLVPKKS